MAVRKLLVLLWLGLTTETTGSILQSWLKHSACRSWIPYGQHKCLTILPEAHNKKTAEIMCNLASEDPSQSSRLLEVENPSEHEFLQHYLFQEKQLNGSVWLGEEILETVEPFQDKCIEMLSDQGSYTAGTLVTVSCNRTNIVVCERLQTPASVAFQSIWSTVKLQVENIVNSTKIQSPSNNTHVETTIDQQDDTVHSISNSSELQDMSEQMDDMELPEVQDITAASITLQPKINIEMSEIEVASTPITQQRSAVEEELHALQLMNQMAEREIVALKEENEVVREEIKLLKHLNTNGINQMTAIKDRCESMIHDLMRQMTEAQIEIAELAKLSDEATKELNFLRHKNEETDMAISKIERRTDAIEEEISEVILKNDVIADNATAASKKINDEIDKEMIAMKQSIDLRNNEDEEVKEKLRKFELILHDQMQRNDATIRILAAMNQSHAATMDSVNSIGTQLELTKTEVNECTARNYLTNLELKALNDNAVPVGYTYTQLPNQLPPNSIWPTLTWREVSSQYAGLFFRTVGGNAASFGQVQRDQARHINSIMSVRHHDTSYIYNLANGLTSARLYSGGGMGLTYAMRFSLSHGEVRPSNTAVKIWVRIK